MNNTKRIDSNMKIAFQTAVAVVAGVTGGNHAYGLTVAGQAYDYVVDKLSVK